MDEIIVRRIEEKRQSRDRVAAKLEAVRKQAAMFEDAEAKHVLDLETKDQVLAMLEKLGEESSSLAERSVELRTTLQSMMAEHREAGTNHRKDPKFMELFDENEQIALRLRELPALANRIYFGKAKL